MASVAWKKLTSQEAAGLAVHLDQEERKKHKHANKDIDPSRTEQNYSLSCESYKSALKSAQERVRAVDSTNPPKRKSKDRITEVSLVAYCPQGVPEKNFFEELDGLYRAKFGEDYHGMQVHFDEIHKYFDSQKRQYVQSLAHSHALVTPFCKWREKREKAGVQYVEYREGINGKNFMTKKSMQDLNKALDDLCMARWNIHYLTGEKRRGKDTDEIKRDSLRAEVETLTKAVNKLEHRKQKAKKQTEILLDAISETLENYPDPDLGRECLNYLSGYYAPTELLERALSEIKERQRAR